MTATMATRISLSHRDHSILVAVAAGRATMTSSVEPDLYVDGLAVCDPVVCHSLLRAGLIEPAMPGPRGSVVPATLTAAGIVALSAWQ